MSDQSMLGIWWRPDNKDQSWAGNLTVNSEGDVVLELLTHDFSPDFAHKYVINGFTAGVLYTTLGLFNTSRKGRFGSTAGLLEYYQVDVAVKDTHLADRHEKFPRFTFSVEGLQDWSRLTGITTTYIQREGSAGIDPEHSRTSPDPVKILAGGLTFRFVSQAAIPGDRWSISVQEDTQIIVTSSTPKSIDEWLNDVVMPIKRLVQFSIKTGGTLRRMAVSRKLTDDRAGASDPDWYEVVYSGTRRYPFDDKPLRFGLPLLHMQDFVEVPGALENWLAMDRKFREPIVGSLNSVLGEPTLDYVFFVYARLLERLVSHYPQTELCDKPTIQTIIAFAKTLVAGKNGDVLGQKIGSQRRNDAKAPLLAALERWMPSFEQWNPDAECRDWIATKIIKTRNHFAHLGRSKPDKMRIQPGELRVFTGLVKTLVDFEIVGQLGFRKNLAAERLKDSRQWNQAMVVRECWDDYCEPETSSNDQT